MKIKVNKRIKGITIAAAALVLIIVVAVMFIIVRYTPAKEKMSGYTYYGIDRNTDKVFVIIDGELYPDTGIIYEGRYYLPQEFIADNINVDVNIICYKFLWKIILTSDFIMIQKVTQYYIRIRNICIHIRKAKMYIRTIQVRHTIQIILL